MMTKQSLSAFFSTYFQGCDLGNACFPLKDPNGCDAACPVSCPGPGSKTCRQNDPSTGCVVAEYCAFPEYDYNGQPCEGVCDVMCDPESEMQCPMGHDSRGCRLEDMCVPVGNEGKNIRIGNTYISIVS